MAQDPRTDPDSPYYDPNFDPGTDTGAPQPTPTPTPSADEQAVIDYYNRYLGRGPEAGDVQKWLSGQYGWGQSGNLAGIEQGIRGSQEAFQHSPTSADDRTDQWSGQFDVAPNELHFENLSGFDFGNLRDPHMQTAKYQFARLAKEFAPNEAGLQQLLKDPRFRAEFPNAKGVGTDKIDFGDGKPVDVGQNFGGANSKWWWGVQGSASGTGTGTGGAKPAGAPLFGGGGGAGGGGGGGGGGGMDFPMLDVPTFVNDLGDYTPETFVNDLGDYTPLPWEAPKPEDVYTDPSYQFRYNEGLKPVTNSLALQGLTRSGATMKALQRYGQNFASDEFDRIYDRAADTYDRSELNRKGAYTTNLGTRQDTFATNELNRKNAYTTNLKSRQDAYGYAVDEATKEFAPRQKWAELQYGRDWDVYKYQNDDAYRRWAASLNASTQGASFGTNNP